MTILGPVPRRIVLVIWCLSVAGASYLSLLPGLELPGRFWNSDKLYHMLAYAWLGGLPAWCIANPARARAVAYAMIPLGALLEWGQSLVPGRTASMGDAVANAVGVFCGIWLAESLLTWLGARRRAAVTRF